MTKTKEWMGQIRRVSPPELWKEVERRALHSEPDPTEPRSRAQAAVILIISVLVIESIVYAPHDIGRASRPLVTGGERNGSIAFVQTHHLGKGPWIFFTAMNWMANLLSPWVDSGKRRASREAFAMLARSLRQFQQERSH